MTNSPQTIAGITNVGICLGALQRIMERSENLPGMAVFYGSSGVGKSMAAAYAANRYRAYYVECKSMWSRKDFMLAIVREMGLQPHKTTSDLMNQAAEELILSRKPLIIDEMDYLVEKQMVNIVRDLYEISKAPILLIGEEQMPKKLKKWERFDGRILEFAPAQPVSIGDAKQLASIYMRGIQISDDLLHAVHHASRGSARRVSVNLDNIREHCLKTGLTHIAAKDWTQGFFTGEAPRRAA